VIDARHVETMLNMEGIDGLGFDQTEQKYLFLLRANQGPVRLNVIATHLGLPRQTVEMLERDFIRVGLIDKTEKGRILTSVGVGHLRTITSDVVLRQCDFRKEVKRWVSKR